jgi:hypothetical protein
MKLENQVVSLDLAKRLKELGVKQESLFAWVKLPPSEKEGYEGEEYGLVYEWTMAHNAGKECISAFTVAELGEMLPKRTRSIKTHEYEFYCNSQVHEWPGQYGDTEADARAKMLIYLRSP